MQAYIIVNTNHNLKEDDLMILGLGTIAATAGFAWYKQTRGDMSKVQYWFDRGYRLRRIEINLLPEVASDDTIEHTD